MKKFIAVLAITGVLGLVGCSLTVAAPAASTTPSSGSASAPSSAPAQGLEQPTEASSDPPNIIVQRPAPGDQESVPSVPAMSVDEVCSAWKQGFKVLNEGSVPAKESMAALEEATAAAPPEIRVQSGIATRILWGQILYPSNQPASAETMGHLAALRQACYDLTGIDVVEGLDE
jgi:hypothetical protein